MINTNPSPWFLPRVEPLDAASSEIQSLLRIPVIDSDTLDILKTPSCLQPSMRSDSPPLAREAKRSRTASVASSALSRAATAAPTPFPPCNFGALKG